MKPISKRDNTGRQPGEVGKTNGDQQRNNSLLSDLFPEAFFSVETLTPPIVSGQCAQVLSLIRQNQPTLSFTLTADHAIPETAARVHDLRAMGFNIITRIVPEVVFRGVIRRNAALYSLGTPEWPRPGFVERGISR